MVPAQPRPGKANRLHDDHANSTGRWEANARHWRATLDAENLGRDRTTGRERQRDLYLTADVRAALRVMGPLRGRRVLDLGGGLGLAAELFAARGAEVVACDLAPERLAACAREIPPELRPRITLVAGTAEDLPFADATFDVIFTKSVMIHTRLERAGAECSRVLAPGGRAVFIEPTAANPFAELYRRFLGPKVWRDITTYFDDERFRRLAAAFARNGGPAPRVRLGRVHLFGFFASAFQFTLPHPGLLRASERILGAIDRTVWRILPASRRMAWFGVLVIERRRHARQRGPTARHTARS